jgi:hypothetical protein
MESLSTSQGRARAAPTAWEVAGKKPSHAPERGWRSLASCKRRRAQTRNRGWWSGLRKRCERHEQRWITPWRLWSGSHPLSEKTIANHLTIIFQKTASENRAAAATFAIRQGLV